MPWLKLRISEWVLVCFFTYVAIISPWFPDRPHLKYQPLGVLAAVFTLFILLANVDRGKLGTAVDIIRDWLPIPLTVAAFREMELFLPRTFAHHYEGQWIRWDTFLLDHWRLRSALESFGSAIPLYLELCYLLLYTLGLGCVAVLYVQRRRESVDRFLTIFLLGTLLAYALFPYFPSEPPRIVFAALDQPAAITWARKLNLWVLQIATIHAGVFPSAHVSEAFSAAWAMFLLLPKQKIFGWGLLWYAISVSIATIYGRYHYAADVLAGFAISVITGALCLFWWWRDSRAPRGV